MATYQAKKGLVERKWHVINLEDKVLGRAATQIANILRGKNKAQYTPHVDVGDFVVAINASKIRLTGNKLEQKQYYWHSSYPGGIKSVSAQKLLKTKPNQVLIEAVKGMLPKNILGRKLIKKLKIYSGADHPHVAQKPEAYSL
ncbi:MAG TPA: 50S ribosomal protein L13 [Deltaproteobacteria bacterium]|nr:MAG: 50S ribosomal protein L13 [Deltaproteobacteria bacterium GWA2_45_12]HBF13224.1 50S ribosomal protein L13 [Deltaproteobacteria bacterium]